jgi:hypothetical protein
VPAPPAPAVPLPTAVPAVPAKKFKVQFSSVPLATLSVDGEKVGPSIPARTLSLEEGEHTVRLEAPGFPPYEKKFHVGSRSENRIHYQFPCDVGSGRAGRARVLVDGKCGSPPDAAASAPAGSQRPLSRGLNCLPRRSTFGGAPKTRECAAAYPAPRRQ